MLKPETVNPDPLRKNGNDLVGHRPTPKEHTTWLKDRGWYPKR